MRPLRWHGVPRWALLLGASIVVTLLALQPGSLPQARGQTAGIQVQPPAGAAFSGTCSFTNGQLNVAPSSTCTITFLAVQGAGTYTVSVSGSATIACPPGETNCTAGSNGQSVTLLASAANQQLTILLTLSSTVVAQGSSVLGHSVDRLARQVEDAIPGGPAFDQPAPASATLSGPQGAIASVAIVPGVVIVYPTGWNLVGVPTNTTLSAAVGSLFTLFHPTDTAYTSVPPSLPLLGSEGYWAFFRSPATVTLAGSGAQGGSVSLPAGRFVQVGNPGTKVVSLSGMDAALSYDPANNNYLQTTTLGPGQGAWVFSRSGGALSLTAIGLPAPSMAR